MNILVTGSNGFLGRELVRMLIRKGHHVTGLDREVENHSVEFLCHDLCEPVPRCRITFDVCIHLASSVGGFLHNALEKGLEANELRLLENLTRFLYNQGCHRILYASSINVFEDSGRFSDGTLNQLPRRTPYARAKALGEKFIESHFCEFVVIRMTNLFGSVQSDLEKRLGHSHVIPELLRKIREQSELEILGDGTQIRNFLHVSDAARFFGLTLNLPEKAWFNLRSDIQLSIAELSQELLQLTQKERPIRFRPEFMKYEPYPIRRFDLSASEALGWVPKIRSISEGLDPNRQN